MSFFQTKNERKNARRAEREAAFDEVLKLEERERARKAALSMYLRIEEADASSDVKEILHMITERLKMED